MATPIILINSATGSDTAASGAGPSTALTGSAGVSAADGLSVILDGSPVLTGVDTTGLHVLYYADTTAGQRNFAKITGTANSGTPTATVTLANAVQAVQTKAWAIGGVRASIGSTTSKKLVDNNGAAGDAQAGWTLQFASGHAETLAASLDLRGVGDTTNGSIIIEGITGAATLPILTFSNNGNCIAPRGASTVLRQFELRNSNATKTASTAIVPIASHVRIEQIKISHSTDKFWKGCFFNQALENVQIVSCEIGYCANRGIDIVTGAGNVGGLSIRNNTVHDCGATAGIDLESNTYFGLIIEQNLIYACTGIGLQVEQARNDGLGKMLLAHNTINGCTSDGIRLIGTMIGTYVSTILNNIVSNNGGYGLNYSTAGVTDAVLAAYRPLIKGNQTYNNTSGAYKSATAGYAYNAAPWAEGDTGANPTYTSSGTGNFALSTPLKAQGFPLGGTLPVGGTSLTYSYVDPGAAQRQEAGGGGGGLKIAGRGGLAA